MKKLLLMVPMLHQGGFERVCVKTARVLEGKWDVTILIFSDKDINYDVSGLRVINIDVPAAGNAAGRVMNLPKRIAKVRAIKKKEKFDIAYSFGSSANLVNVFSREGEKVVTGLRCQTDLESPNQVRLFCRRSDEVLSCSREIVRQLEKDFSYKRSEYIYNPLDVDDIRAKSEEMEKEKDASAAEKAEFTSISDESGTSAHAVGEAGSNIANKATNSHGHLIFGMGRDDRIKGFWHLIKAFSLVKKEIPDARLCIMGAGSFDGAKKLASDLGIADAVALPGVRKNPFPYLAQCDLFVLPSNHEGFPNALLEAMALSKPVIAADCKTGPREIVLSDDEYEKLIAEKPDGSSVSDITEGEYGVLVPDMCEEPDHEAANITDEDRMLAAAIIAMLSDDRKLAHYAEKAGERAAAYSPACYADSLSDILDGILKSEE